jgi:chemotaxis signal transduction protein
VLLVDEGEETLGLLVDQVLQVFRLREDELELAAAMGGDTAEYVLGVGRPRTAGRAGGRLSPRVLETPLEKEDILILLDPKQLLRK